MPINGTMMITHARVVTPDAVLPEAAVAISGGRILEIRCQTPRTGSMPVIDARGRLLVPGFIDIHSDVIENAIQPRPGGRFPVDVALHELDKQLTACGVTSIFHCLCFLGADEDPPFRNAETTDSLIRQIHELRPDFRARTFIHARYEITHNDSLDRLEELVRQGQVHFLSLMDHTPGQGQFSEIANFRAYYSKARGLSGEQVDAVIAQRLSASRKIDWEGLARLARRCRESGIRMASHDDDSAEKIARVSRLGVSLAEFPVNLAAARAAHQCGMLISLGSPNVLRGASLTGNLSGREALSAGRGDILCSDYAPMSLLHAALQLYREGLMTLPQAVRLITLNPARAVGIDDWTGAIAPGKAADLVLVDDGPKVAGIRRTWMNGREVFCSGG
jgi:alpha-D-ribose 1-methylphosphonate 5-triphosphate diphosphatase